MSGSNTFKNSSNNVMNSHSGQRNSKPINEPSHSMRIGEHKKSHGMKSPMQILDDEVLINSTA